MGCAVGFLIPPEIVPNHPNLDVVGEHLAYMFYGGAGVTTFLFILVLACKLLREKGKEERMYKKGKK